MCNDCKCERGYLWEEHRTSTIAANLQQTQMETQQVTQAEPLKRI